MIYPWNHFNKLFALQQGIWKENYHSFWWWGHSSWYLERQEENMVTSSLSIQEKKI